MASGETHPPPSSLDSAGVAESGLGYARDPYPDFARLRQDSPVTRQDAAFVGGPPSDVVYSHDAVTEVLHDGDTCSLAIIPRGIGPGLGSQDHRRIGRT